MHLAGMYAHLPDFHPHQTLQRPGSDGCSNTAEMRTVMAEENAVPGMYRIDVVPCTSSVARICSR